MAFEPDVRRVSYKYLRAAPKILRKIKTAFFA